MAKHGVINWWIRRLSPVRWRNICKTRWSKSIRSPIWAGGGISTGRLIGATDRQGGFPVSHPTHPHDIHATAYHLLGFDPHLTTIPDRTGRPMHITEGQVVRELLA